MDFDAAWCPVCDRQIIPKRIQVPVPPPPPPLPTSQSPIIRKSKGGTIKRAPSGHPNARPKPQPDAPKPAHPTKFRTVIDQGPIPLYCSDQCRLADLHTMTRGLPLRPDRATSPVPSQTSAVSETESGSTASSLESLSSGSSSASSLSPSMATLAALYKFPPAPPAPPLLEESSSSDSELCNDYSSGIMMAGRYIDSVCPKPVKRSSYAYPQPAPDRQPVPGWSDGSNAWRSSVYSFSSPKKNCDLEGGARAYRSFAASPHRSQGVYSSLGEMSAATPRNAASAASPPSATELMQKYSQSFNRRSETRSSINSGSVPASPTPPHSFPPTVTSSPRRERPIVQRGAEGKLLVPDIKLKVHSNSSTSLSSGWSSSAAGSRKDVSLASSDTSDDEAKLSKTAKRPVSENRSWSYENFKTYPIMPFSPKEKRLEKRIVDGREVEVEVEVEQPLKRLFLFPPSLRQA